MFDLLFSETNNSTKFTHQLDPRAKIILLIMFISVLLSTSIKNPIGIAVLGLLLLLMLWHSDLRLSKLGKLFVKIYPIILLISLFQLLKPDSDGQLYSGFSFDVSYTNVLSVIELQVYTLFTFGATVLFVFTTPFFRFLKSLEKLKLPSWIVSTIFFIYRFIYILAHELNRMSVAYRSRYIKLNTITRIRIQSQILAVFIARVFERNDRLYHALISRGFNGAISFNVPLSWRLSDTLILISAFLFTVIAFGF